MQIMNVLWETYEARTAAAREQSLPDLETDKVSRQSCSPQAQGVSTFWVKVLAHELICADCTEIPAFWYNTQLPQGIGLLH